DSPLAPFPEDGRKRARYIQNGKRCVKPIHRPIARSPSRAVCGSRGGADSRFHGFAEPRAGAGACHLPEVKPVLVPAQVTMRCRRQSAYGVVSSSCHLEPEARSPEGPYWVGVARAATTLAYPLPPSKRATTVVATSGLVFSERGLSQLPEMLAFDLD